LVITVPKDEETHQVCQRHDLDCHNTSLLCPDGSDFQADANKGALINEGLEVLIQIGRDRDVNARWQTHGVSCWMRICCCRAALASACKPCLSNLESFYG
jgi:hypothetical protein